MTAAESGARYGYSLVTLQIILIPVLYIVQELTIRLALFTGLGYGELVKKHFGIYWAYFSVTLLLLGCTGALVSQMSSIAGVGALYGIPSWISILLTCFILAATILTGSYDSSQKIMVFCGVFEFLFVLLMFISKPSPAEVFNGMLSQGGSNFTDESGWWLLVTANIGAVVMPWMIFFQQSSAVDMETEIRLHTISGEKQLHSKCNTDTVGSSKVTEKSLLEKQKKLNLNNSDETRFHVLSSGRKLTYYELNFRDRSASRGLEERLYWARVNTFFGAVLTQLIMSSVIILFATTIWVKSPNDRGQRMSTVKDLSVGMTQFIGDDFGKLAFSLAMIGSGFIASNVVTLTAAWGLSEIVGSKHSLQNAPTEAPLFYLAAAAMIIVSVIVSLMPSLDTIYLNIGVSILNAFLVPFVLVFLFLLSTRKDVLPKHVRLQGIYKLATGIVMCVLSLLSLSGIVMYKSDTDNM
eukprot:g2047.t1